MSCLLLFWMLFFLGNLLKNPGHFIGSLALLEKTNKPKRVHGHYFVFLHKLELIRFGLREEDLFALLLCCGQLHRSTDVDTVKIAEKLYSTPHEFMHVFFSFLFLLLDLLKDAGHFIGSLTLLKKRV
jgi:hypothetical protein